MISWSAYARLMRLDKPIGIFLLWYPTAWALWVACKGIPQFDLLLVFTLGTVFMRSAGCVLNDIVDRHIDLHVERTKNRPLTSGELTLSQAIFALTILLAASALLLLKLPLNCFYLALISVFISFIYPFCKRFLQAPQMILGIAFSMGIPMVFAATGNMNEFDVLFMMLINYLWIVAYDTMYAMADKMDDLKIGVKSTAIYFANYDKLVIGLLQLTFHSLWLVWGLMRSINVLFYVFWLLALGVLVYQQKLIRERIPALCFRAFLISNYYGLLMWCAVATSY
ncbi:4-hydroxybenzoate octaprenyltransferase [Legionella waltersii]|uniref:4-hydroxybenzoate octaprenyltransferase n=1 Tax=Legionella waltersii TaxID=66969 RepID=A0A0W1ALV5_9GAMM|nr:4-hydroxybenzoate octaprenyltransferase [Legionella waltersii]KTD82270.1 4-hydroxybenzoate polyprenyltransferase [Legionella waltersii]SNV04367.1 4-hydroxybenzoate octaprenyltransferase [Legionella waltersii]